MRKGILSKRVEVGIFCITYDNFQSITVQSSHPGSLSSFFRSHLCSCSSSSSSLPWQSSFLLLPRLQTIPRKAMQPASMVRRNPVSKLNPLEPARANWVPVPTSGHSSFTWWHLMVGLEDWKELWEDREIENEMKWALQIAPFPVWLVPSETASGTCPVDILFSFVQAYLQAGRVAFSI